MAGASFTKAALIAADDINAHGGVRGRKIEIITYDNHSSAADLVRAFQRAVGEDKVIAVVGSYLSEVALALEPWSARLRVPFITPGAASDLISKAIHEDYDHNKYTFHGMLTSTLVAKGDLRLHQRDVGRSFPSEGQQDGRMRQQLIEHLMREIMNYDAEFRSEEATGSSGSIARH